MINYIEYLKLPTQIAVILVGVFLVIQIIGEILEFKGKVVPEFVKIRKYFARKRREREVMRDMPSTISEVKKSLAEFSSHYSTDNIRMRDDWIKNVNNRLEDFDKKLDKSNQDILTLIIDNKRNTIIDFASIVADEKSSVTREQFNRIFKLYEEYETIIEANGLTNGEVDIAIRIIKESYENHMRNHTFIEDIRGYN